MQALAVIGLILLGAVFAPILIMLVAAIPDIVRYFRLRRM